MTTKGWFRLALVASLGAFAFVPGQAFAWTSGDSSTLTAALDSFTLSIDTNDDTFSTEDLSTVLTDPGTYHSPGFPSTTTDSGFCGTDWATDHVTRYFTVRQVDIGSWQVYEQFKDGTFTAPIAPATSEPSPGSCANHDGGMITGPITGSFHGYEVINVTATTFDPTAADNGCAPPPTGCTTTGQWIEAAFDNTAVYTVPAFFDNYEAPSQNLAVNQWKNASCPSVFPLSENRGGNQGDIATTVVTKSDGTYGCV
jgi:hypothetical protein